GVAQAEYLEEVIGVIRNTNVTMVQERMQGASREEVHAIIDEVERSGDPVKGIKPEDILFMPDSKFFRKRGPEEVIFKPYDARGALLTEAGKPLTQEGYLRYLSTVLPEKFIGSREYNKYVAQLKEFLASR